MTSATARADVLASEALPYDGPHARGDVLLAATLTAELVRRLNNATRSFAIFEEPADVAVILAQLVAAAERMPQLINQLGAQLVRFQEHPLTYTTRPEHTASSTIDLARVFLAEASLAADKLAASLRNAQGFTNTLGIDDQEAQQ